MHRSCKLRASLGGGGRLAQGTRPLRGILPYVVLISWVACPAGGFSPQHHLGSREGKGIIQEYISKISAKIEKNSRNSNNAISDNGSMLGSLQDNNNF